MMSLILVKLEFWHPGNENSFLHVIKAEIDLPELTDPYSEEVYHKGLVKILIHL